MKKFRVVLIVLILFLFAALIYEVSRPYRAANEFDMWTDGLVGRQWGDDPASDTAYQEFVTLIETGGAGGELSISHERSLYEGDMTLVIPSLDVNTPVRNGATQKELRYGPALFEFADLPGNEGQNVSIAGHREGGVFFYLDKLAEGDDIFLIYKQRIFRYKFYDRKDVLPSDWGIIERQGFSCVTLVTCTPIGVADHRMVVRGELTEVMDEEAGRAEWGL
ncbi:MAG: class E sortase [Clostridiales bacterium]|jgi:LPXTG-site transpeptidase (sortase) family protein|nr:class E sortase [Clostridiales bacterium]